MCLSLVSTILLGFSVVSPASASRQLGILQRLRPLHPQLERSLRDAYAKSPTVQSLVDELEQSDLIVHIVPRGADSGPPGALSGSSR
jgi:hypothetical protein